MPALSLRQALDSTSDGQTFFGSVFALNPFYEPFKRSPLMDLQQGVVVSYQDVIPYKNARSRLESLHWPLSEPMRASEFDHPKGSAPGWSHRLQGVTHDEDNWYFAQDKTLWKIPVGHDLSVRIADEDDRPPGTIQTGVPEPLAQAVGRERFHYGDLDFHDGKLYVAVENDPKTRGIAVFDTNLHFLAFAPLPQQSNVSWCAINPLNGLLYSSNFNGSGVLESQPSQPLQLHVYKPTLVGNTLNLFQLPAFPLFSRDGAHPLVLNRIQGGAFSRNGHLYLVSDLDFGGVYGFDIVTGRQQFFIRVNYAPHGVVFGRAFQKQELQGITIWDLDSGRAPGIRGDIHLIMSDKEWEAVASDDVYFKHFVVGSADDKGKV